jgi:putative ABC transport system ATP-binding protein
MASDNSSSVVIRASGLVKRFGEGDAQVVALRHVDLTVPARQFLVIMGASGSGKSTLLHILGGIEVPTEGAVYLEEVDLAGLDDDALTLLRRRRIGFVFQSFNLLPTLTAQENVAFPLVLDGVAADEANRRAREMLGAVGVGHRAASFPATMSGGEQQRVAIARALVIDPAVILADEPTGNLDSVNTRLLVDTFRHLVDDLGRTVVMVTHEVSLVQQADRVLVLQDGQVRADLPPSKVTLDLLETLAKASQP